MANWYNIEVQMLGMNERNYELDEQIGWELGFAEKDIDEREPHRLTAVFESPLSLDQIHAEIQKLMNDIDTVAYIDIYSCADGERLPVRSTVFSDGKVQKYRTKVYYEEENDNE